MKKFKFTIRGNEYEVEVKNLEDGLAKIDVNGTSYEVELQKEEKTSKTPILVRHPVPTSKDAHKIKKTKGGGTLQVKAPLPGNILDIYIKEGDEVKKEDKLLLYEAMKMENTILAEKVGRIKSIKVKPGDTVLQDDVLIELELE